MAESKTQFTLGQAALHVSVLHAVKHSALPVYGVFLARSEGKRGMQLGSNAGSVDIREAIPLFHQHPLAPALEVAMEQVMTLLCFYMAQH